MRSSSTICRGANVLRLCEPETGGGCLGLACFDARRRDVAHLHAAQVHVVAAGQELSVVEHVGHVDMSYKPAMTMDHHMFDTSL